MVYVNEKEKKCDKNNIKSSRYSHKVQLHSILLFNIKFRSTIRFRYFILTTKM